MLVTEGLVEQHIHGAFGIDFMTCTAEELIFASQNLFKCAVTAFFPTIMTSNIDLIKERIDTVKKAMRFNNEKTAQIAGIHLEGPFINPQKAGIHQKEFICPLDVKIFEQIEDDIIKIVTLAPELDEKNKFINYLRSKNIKISAGHTICSDLSKVNQVTHLYNAMGNFHHRLPSTSVCALCNDTIYTEIIADSKHVCDNVLKITFRQKPIKKILLISDALPLAHSTKKELVFAGQTIYNNDGSLLNKDGTMAGSSLLLCDIVKNVVDRKLLSFKDAIQASSSNQLEYHNIKNNLKVYWNRKYLPEMIEFIKY